MARRCPSYLSRVQSVVLIHSAHPYRLCLKAIIAANRPDSRPWMCLVMCIVWLSHDIWSVLDKVYTQ